MSHITVETKTFKEVCSSVLTAIDNSEISTYTEALELELIGDLLYLNITNKEYYMSAKFQPKEIEVKVEESFRAVINAHTFLNLIKNFTTENITFEINDNYLLVKADGNYKFALIYENGELMKLPKVVINNETLCMNVGGDLLSSISTYNSKVLSKRETTPIQKLYYLDQEGCITFTACACINNFKLEKPIKLLLNNKVVRLFKLFANEMVLFHLGYDQLSENIIQTKIKVESRDLSLTSILPSDTLLPQYPVDQLRRLANKIYPFTAVLNVKKFASALNRLKLLDKNNDDCYITCNVDEVTIRMDDNQEVIPTANGSEIDEEYSMILKASYLQSILDACEDQYITFNFGDKHSTTFVRGNVADVIPEVMESGE